MELILYILAGIGAASLISTLYVIYLIITAKQPEEEKTHD